MPPSPLPRARRPAQCATTNPKYRHLIGRAFNTLVRLMVLPGLQDTQCGFKCFRADAAEAIFPLLTIRGWTFDVEALFIARQLGYTIIEVPIPWRYRKHSRVKVLRDSLHMAADLLTIRLNARKGLYKEADMPAQPVAKSLRNAPKPNSSGSLRDPIACMLRDLNPEGLLHLT